jgi:hypothetical protein
MDEDRGEQGLVVLYGCKVLRQSDLVDPLPGRRRQPDVIAGRDLEACPEIALSRKRETSALEESGNPTPFLKDRRGVALSGHGNQLQRTGKLDLQRWS